MIEWKYFHGSNPYKYILDKRTSIDIDDGLDLACARAWLDMDESVSQIDPYSIDNYENIFITILCINRSGLEFTSPDSF